MSNLAHQHAFPIPMGGYLTDVGHQFSRMQPGMTYRQWLAGIALSGLMCRMHVDEYTWGKLASDAAEAADALIRELEKQ